MLFKDRAVFKRIHQVHETSGPAAGKEARSGLTLASRFLSAGYTTKRFWCGPQELLNSHGTQLTEHAFSSSECHVPLAMLRVQVPDL